MPMDFGSESMYPPDTMRGEGWPCIRQFNIFLENRVGRLHELLRRLESENVRVMALSVIDSGDCAIARLVLNNYERAKEIFDLSEFNYFETDLVGVLLPDDPQPYLRICMALMQAELNIHYTYPLLYRKQGRGAIALYIEDVDQALKTLKERGYKTVTESDLFDYDEFT
jgi:hypothetical protein